MPLNNRMGLGHERFDAALGAWVSDYRFSESNHRQFYKRWADLMEAADWNALGCSPAREAEHV
jgi:hypothetical protein